MTVQIIYKNNSLKASPANYVLFVDEKFNIQNIKKYISNTDFTYISDLLKNSDLKKRFTCF
jgi:leucyl aminopeptidase